VRSTFLCTLICASLYLLNEEYSTALDAVIEDKAESVQNLQRESAKEAKKKSNG